MWIFILGWVFLSTQLWNQQKSSPEERLPSKPAAAPTTDHFHGLLDHWRQRTKSHCEDDLFWGFGTQVPSFLLLLGHWPSFLHSIPHRPGLFLPHYHQSGHLLSASVTSIMHTLTLSTCSQTLASQSLSCLKGRGVSVLGVIAQRSPSFGHFQSDLG